MSATLDLQAAVLCAITSVDDPEYPGVSIVDLGILEQLNVDATGSVDVGLIPTFSGCPALDIIATDVEAAVAAVDGIGDIEVRWLRSPVWSVERLSNRGQRALAEQFTVAVQIRDRAPVCPRCGGSTSEQSMFGPSRCRSVHRCTSCSETVEVVRA